VLEEAVYGLPELRRKEIKEARLVANPGCYPTAALLGLAPLVRAGMVETGGIVIDAKSGTTGAGRKADVSLSFCEVNEGFRAYGVTSHRHTPEIEQELTALAGETVAVTFTPHLLPLDRGILCTTYARAAKPVDEDELRRVFERAYAREPFVEVLGPGELPNVKYVRGGNRCHLAVAYNGRTGTVIVITAIDNLVKGAAGQAVQCMNLMTGLRETTGLLGPALAP
jgi:N-acetyl-gamma-glutamyl-phosphate reductase